MRRNLCAFLLVACVGALLTAAPTQAAFPGTNGKIAFTRHSEPPFGPNPHTVVTTNPDGSGESTLALGGDPAWSPDGRRIVFRDQFYDIVVMNSDGTGRTTLTGSDTSDLEPAWSPDGSKIVFRVRDIFASTANIFVMNSDGTEKRLLADPPGHEIEPAWSPDGIKIAFAVVANASEVHEGEELTRATLWLVDADGSNPRSLNVSGRKPNWSPDGQKIAFHRIVNQTPSESGDLDVFTMNPDGSGQTNVSSRIDVADQAPAWSPDGNKIAFSSNRDSANPGVCTPGDRPQCRSYEMYSMNADGTSQTRLTTLSGSEYDADWQPLPHQSDPPPSFDHPRLASPLEVSLVPVHRPTLSESQCQARGGSPSAHGAPLAFSSCNPPAYRPGTVARLGPAAEGTARLGAIYGDTNAANGDGANLAIRASLTDVQTQAGADYAPSPTGADVTLVVQLRLSDTYNGPALADPGTTVNLEYPVPVDCAPTVGLQGSTCDLDTSADALTPEAIRENESMVLGVLRIRVDDSGVNGTRGDADDRIFATHGL